MYWMHNIGPAILTSLWQSAFLYILFYVHRRSRFTKPNHSYILGVSLQWLLTGVFIHDIYASAPVTCIGRIGLLRNDFLHKILSNNYISYIYTFFLILNIALFLFKSISSEKKSNESEYDKLSVPKSVELLVTKWKNKLKIRQPVRLVIQKSIDSPFTKNFLKPVIVLPLSFINGLGANEMEAVLLHELWHIRRYDYLFLVGQSCMEKVMYFNPFFLLIGKAIHEDRELSCDIKALSTSHLNTTHYIDTLLFFTPKNNIVDPARLSITGKHNGELLNRVAYLLEKKKNRIFQASVKMNLIAIAAFILNIIYLGQENGIVATNTQTAKNIAVFSSDNTFQYKKDKAVIMEATVSNIEKINHKNRRKEKQGIDNKEVAYSTKNKINNKPSAPTLKQNGENSDNSLLAVNDEETDNSRNAFVRATYIPADNSNTVVFKPLEVNADKALFAADIQNTGKLNRIFNNIIRNITNDFPIESSTSQYSVFTEKNQFVETYSTELKSANYTFLLIKRQGKLLLAVTPQKQF